MDEAYGRFLQESCRLGIVPELPVKPQKKKEVLVLSTTPSPLLVGHFISLIMDKNCNNVAMSARIRSKGILNNRKTCLICIFTSNIIIKESHLKCVLGFEILINDNCLDLQFISS